MSRFELLAPAGDLEKLKVAILYGANAVFIGGLQFSLRSRASNFTLEDIREACLFAHNHNAKIHVTCNIVLHEKDTDGVIEYLKALDNCGVDAVIASSLYILKMVILHTSMEAHVSTQASTANAQAVKFYESIGAKRTVLARELSLDEIEKVKKDVSKLVGEDVQISVIEIKNPDVVAQVVADTIAHNIENRVSFRVAQKKAIRNTMKAGAKGIKTLVSGRLGGADIARGEGYSEGTIPLHTLRANIDYATSEADTTYGKIGVKVWIYKGEILDEKGGNTNVNAKKNKA